MLLIVLVSRPEMKICWVNVGNIAVLEFTIIACSHLVHFSLYYAYHVNY